MRCFALIDGKPGSQGVVFPDLPGCTAMGDTLDQAVTEASAALANWIGTVEGNGGAVPPARSAEALRRDPEIADALRMGRAWLHCCSCAPLESLCAATSREFLRDFAAAHQPNEGRA